MSNFIDEICEKLGFEEKLLSGAFKLICFSFSSCLIEGHKGILKLGEEEMRFKVKGGMIKIFGSGLTLKNFSKFSAVVEGKITKQEFEKNELQSKS